ncbi:MAG: hypothetical protein EXQ86_06255 [Rhodospirillales bacterium]|nr:hypothetical protein [Rhodospirillales bacterium]
MNAFSGPALAFVFAAALVIPAAHAQQQPDQGVVRAQGRIVGQQDAPPTGPSRAFVDYREEMRKLIQQIAAFTRQTRRDFVVLPQGGLDLLSRKDEVDETKSSPARTYMRSIDGIMVEGLFNGRPPFSPEDLTEARGAWLRQADLAKRSGLKVFVIDTAGDPKAIDAFHKRSGERGFVGFAVANPDFQTLEIPPYPPRPVGENALSILSLGNVKNFLYLSESSAFGRMDEFALAMHGTNYDMVVVDLFHGRDPLSKQAVATLKYKKAGGAPARPRPRQHRVGRELSLLLEAELARRLARLDQRSGSRGQRSVFRGVLAAGVEERDLGRRQFIYLRGGRSGIRRCRVERRRHLSLLRNRGIRPGDAVGGVKPSPSARVADVIDDVSLIRRIAHGRLRACGSFIIRLDLDVVDVGPVVPQAAMALAQADELAHLFVVDRDLKLRHADPPVPGSRDACDTPARYALLPRGRLTAP